MKENFIGSNVISTLQFQLLVTKTIHIPKNEYPEDQVAPKVSNCKMDITDIATVSLAASSGC